MSGRYDFEIDAGADFIRTLTCKNENGTPIDLTGYSAALKMRRVNDDKRVSSEFGTANGFITLGGVAGTIAISINNSKTAQLEGQYNYDLTITSQAGIAVRILSGKITVNP